MPLLVNLLFSSPTGCVYSQGELGFNAGCCEPNYNTVSLSVCLFDMQQPRQMQYGPAMQHKAQSWCLVGSIMVHGAWWLRRVYARPIWLRGLAPHLGALNGTIQHDGFCHFCMMVSANKHTLNHDEWVECSDCHGMVSGHGVTLNRSPLKHSMVCFCMLSAHDSLPLHEHLVHSRNCCCCRILLSG